MSPLVTIVVEPSRSSGDDARLRAQSYRVGVLRDALAAILGVPVTVLEGYLSAAPTEGAILLFTSYLEQAVAEAPPGTADRVFWLNGHRTAIPPAMARHGFAGAADGMHVALWTKIHPQVPKASVYVRQSIAEKMGAAGRRSSVPECFIIDDERWSDLGTALGACIAALLDQEPPPAAPPLARR